MFAIILERYTLFLLILLRISGAIFTNHLFGRKNVPTIVKVGMTVILSILLTVNTKVPIPEISNFLDFVIKGIFEFAVGYAISIVMYIFFSTIILACEQIDMQIGIAIAKVYDPGSGSSSAVTGLIYNSFMILLFFATNSHITFFNMLAQTIVAVPCGSAINLSAAGYQITLMFGSMIVLAVKFALPIIAVQFITETGLGVLTRAVPNINIFSVGIQLKLIVGILILVLMAPAFGAFCDSVFTQMFTDMAKAIRLL